MYHTSMYLCYRQASTGASKRAQRQKPDGEETIRLCHRPPRQGRMNNKKGFYL